MPDYKYSRDDYYRLTNAPCLDVAMALGMEINEKGSDKKSWKMKGEQGLCIYREGNNWYRFSDGRHGFPIDLVKDKLGCTTCLLYTSPSPRDRQKSRMPSSA